MDFNKAGTSQKQFEKAKGSSFAEIGKLKDGVNTHRVISGPEVVRTIWYPTLAEKEGKVVQSMRTVVVPQTGSPFDSFVKMDEEIMKASMAENGFSSEEIKKYRSALRPRISYRFLVFDRELDGGGKPTIRVFDYPMQVKDHIEDLQTTKSQKRPGFLEYGLAFMYDIYITKSRKGKSKNVAFDTDYTSQVVVETLPAMKQIQVPIDWLNWDGQGEPPWNWSDYFTEDELVAIEEYPSDLSVLAKSMPESDILALLQKQPIYMGAKFNFGDRKDELMFPWLQEPEYVAKLEQAMAMGGLLVSGEVEERPAQKQIAAPKPVQAAKPVSAPKPMPKPIAKPEPVEEAEVVEEEEQDVPPVVEQAPPPPPAKPAMAPKVGLPKFATPAQKPAEPATDAPAGAPAKRLWAKPKSA